MAIVAEIISQYNDTGVRKADKSLGGFEKRADKFANNLSRAMGLAAVAVAGFATKLAIDGVKAASDFEETLSKTRVIFGKSAADIEKWSKTSASAFGQSRTQALDAASQFATFGKAAGLQGKPLTKFSKRLVELSSDFASFYNTSPEEAITAIGAALRGESEPIRKYGILLNDATLKAEALDMGLYSGKGTLEQSAKVLASYKTVLKQSSDAQGDFTRTADGLANGQRTLTAEWDNAQVLIGEALLPVVTDLVKYLNSSEGKKAIKDFAEGFASSIKTIAEELPGILEKIKSIAQTAGRLGIKWESFADPKLIAAAAAFKFAPGGLKGKVIAGLIAYGATGAVKSAGDALDPNKGGLSKTGSVLGEVSQSTGGGGSPFGVITGNVGKLLSVIGLAQDVQSKVERKRERQLKQDIIININGAIDPASTALQIQRTLAKVERFGGSLIGAGSP